MLRRSRRLTADVDVTVFLGAAKTESLVTELDGRGLELRVQDEDGFVAQTRVLPLVPIAEDLIAMKLFAAATTISTTPPPSRGREQTSPP